MSDSPSILVSRSHAAGPVFAARPANPPAAQERDRAAPKFTLEVRDG